MTGSSREAAWMAARIQAIDGTPRWRRRAARARLLAMTCSTARRGGRLLAGFDMDGCLDGAPILRERTLR
jgi:hypothetical protein